VVAFWTSESPPAIQFKKASEKSTMESYTIIFIISLVWLIEHIPSSWGSWRRSTPLSALVHLLFLYLSSWYQIAHGNRKEMWRIFVCVHTSIHYLQYHIALDRRLSFAHQQKLHPWGMALFHAYSTATKQDPSSRGKNGFYFWFMWRRGDGATASHLGNVALSRDCTRTKTRDLCHSGLFRALGLPWFDAKKAALVFFLESFSDGALLTFHAHLFM